VTIGFDSLYFDPFFGKWLEKLKIKFSKRALMARDSS
jgi:hypothetical protein